MSSHNCMDMLTYMLDVFIGKQYSQPYCLDHQKNREGSLPIAD